MYCEVVVVWLSQNFFVVKFVTLLLVLVIVYTLLVTVRYVKINSHCSLKPLKMLGWVGGRGSVSLFLIQEMTCQLAHLYDLINITILSGITPNSP